jgi:hypothetical protein
VSGRAGGPAALAKVAAGPARSLGEPAAAQDSAASAVAATSFGTAAAQAVVWTRRADTTLWRRAGSLLPAGFASSYDPAAAAAPGGPLLVVAGTAPSGGNCIANSSIAIASVDAQGGLGAARLVSDQRGTSSFDDRPMVAVGEHGMVWVAWSQGPDADACQDVGDGDRIEVATSRDGGRTFGSPVAMPVDGGHSAFGVRIAPLPGGQAAVSWTETMDNGDQGVLVSVVGAGGPRPPELALTGEGPPLILPGASFYDFPAGDIAALPGGKLAVAAPFWVSGRSVIKLAVGLPGGQWQETDLSPPAGADLLLPALGVLSPGTVRLLCAVHTRLGDRLGYDWADITVGGHGPSVSPAGLTTLTPAPSGPGFFEIGEELALARTQRGLLTAVVVAGREGATLETAMFGAPPAAPAPSRGTGTPTGSPRPGPTGSPTGSPTAAGHAAPGTGAPRGRNGATSGLAVTTAWLGAAVLFCAAAGIVLLRRRRAAVGRAREGVAGEGGEGERREGKGREGEGREREGRARRRHAASRRPR